MGLKDVGVRLNDFVEFVSPLSNNLNYPEHVASFLSAKGCDSEITDELYALSARCLVISYGTKI